MLLKIKDKMGRTLCPAKLTFFQLTCVILSVIPNIIQYFKCYLDFLIITPDNHYMKKSTRSVNEAFAEMGKSLKTWRLVYALKATQVAERAGISLGTLHKIENGDPSVSTAAFLEVVRSLGMLTALTESLDPLNSDLGRARVSESLPKRIR